MLSDESDTTTQGACSHEWVYVGLESMNRKTARGVWETDVRGNVANFLYRILYCKFCASFIKIMHTDQYGNNPLVNQPEYDPYGSRST